MKQIMKLQRITQAALLGAVIALPATSSAQDAVVEAQDKVVETTEAVPAAAGQQLLPPSRDVLVKESRIGGGTYENRPAAVDAIYESSPAQNQNRARPRSMGRIGGSRSLLPRQVTLNNQLQQAVNALHKAKTDAEKAGAKKLLKAELSQQFAADMKRRRDELQAIKQRVAKMEAMFQKRLGSKDEIVGLRLQTLVNNAEGLGWSTGPSTPRPWPASPPQQFYSSSPQPTKGWPVPHKPQAIPVAPASPTNSNAAKNRVPATSIIISNDPLPQSN